jgi:hypothetical protein
MMIKGRNRDTTWFSIIDIDCSHSDGFWSGGLNHQTSISEGSKRLDFKTFGSRANSQWIN